jgi:signal transduction histidine kinase
LNRLKLYIILNLFLFVCNPTIGADNKALTDSISKRLAMRPSYAEQVQLLHNLIDLSTSESKSKQYYTQLFNIASAHHDEHTRLEAIRYKINAFQDSLVYFMNLVHNMPPCNDQKETLVFIEYFYNLNVLRTKSSKAQSDYLVNLIKKYRINKNPDIYNQANLLLNIIASLSSISEGEMLTNYLKLFGAIIDRLPADGRNCLPNLYYSMAPNLFVKNGMFKEAHQADQKFLKFLDEFEIKARKAGRIYKHFDTYRYISLRRMLLDTLNLSQSQIHEVFNKMVELSKHNADIYDDIHSPASTAMIYYYMATKQYRKAIPYLDKYIKNVKSYNNFAPLTMFLRSRITAGLHLHNDPDLLKYTLLYINALEETNKNELAQKAKELQIIYDVNGLTQQVSKLELAKKQDEINSSRRNTAISVIALLIVLLLLGLSWWQLLRSKKLAKTLKQSQKDLIDEKTVIMDTMDKLDKARNDAIMADKMKTLFIQNMDHEIRTPLNAIVGFTQVLTDNEIELDNEEKTEYASLILKNNDLLLKLVSDVFDIAQMESGSIQTSIEPCSLNDICSAAYESMKMRTEKNVTLSFSAHSSDFMLNTDRQRILQLLNNYLSNACKFTRHGEITLDYSVDEESETVTFSVTDTGIGIPADKADKIFERFEKLNSFDQGTGLGLHVCKLIAKTLHGEVKLDTTYHSGSRFLFLHPFKQPSASV